MRRRRNRGAATDGGELGFDALPLIDVLSSSLGAAMMLFLIVVVAPQGGEIIRDALGVSRAQSADAAGFEAFSPVDAPGLRTGLMMTITIEAAGLTGRWTGLRKHKSILAKEFDGNTSKNWRLAVADASLVVNGTAFRLSAPYAGAAPAPFTATIVYGAEVWSLGGELDKGEQFLFDFRPNSSKKVRCRPHDCTVKQEMGDG
ncbi:MAG: hypothetical protein KAH11_10000 [Rhodospirillales bacterium]|nr:hypothetical protein [Rhodospirillales bacterium]